MTKTVAERPTGTILISQFEDRKKMGSKEGKGERRRESGTGLGGLSTPIQNFQQIKILLEMGEKRGRSVSR